MQWKMMAVLIVIVGQWLFEILDGTYTARLKHITQIDDPLIFCEGGCNKWRHIWSEVRSLLLRACNRDVDS